MERGTIRVHTDPTLPEHPSGIPSSSSAVFEALAMPKTGPYRPNRCLHDPLAMAWMPVKFEHAPEWISACVGKFSRTSLPAEEQRA